MPNPDFTVPPLPSDLAVSIDVTAHGPLDGRHVIVLPEDTNDEERQAIIEGIGDHFTRLAHARGEDPAKCIPLIVFGPMTVLPSEPLAT